jgi:dTDP-4-amino-4,6-dideoxygalactose transaminase
MKVDFIRLDRSYQKFRDEYLKAATEVLDSCWYIMGNRVKQFEAEFAQFTGSRHCIGLNSGLDALVLAFRALGIGPGDEVIVPANTFIASMLGITENGAIPVFVEPDEYYNLDAGRIEEAITARTKSILVVHLYGQAANMTPIKEIATRHGLFLVEDCAQSHGACFGGKMTGLWGDVGCFSFYPTKNVGAFGDAGAVVTDNDQLADKIRMLRNYGSKVKYTHEIVGVNSRLDEIQAALLSVKLRHYDELRSERAAIASRYLQMIDNPAVQLPQIRPGADHVWHLFVLYVEERDLFRAHLASHGIATQIHYPIPPHLSKAYTRLGHKPGSFPVTENYAAHSVSLPLFEGMSNEELSYVVKTVNMFLKEKG